MRKNKREEDALHEAYEKGSLVSAKPSKAVLRKFKKSVQATFVMEKRSGMIRK